MPGTGCGNGHDLWVTQFQTLHRRWWLVTCCAGLPGLPLQVSQTRRLNPQKSSVSQLRRLGIQDGGVGRAIMLKTLQSGQEGVTIYTYTPHPGKTGGDCVWKKQHGQEMASSSSPCCYWSLTFSSPACSYCQFPKKQ